MKKIAIEEAFATESLIDAWRAMIADGAPGEPGMIQHLGRLINTNRGWGAQVAERLVDLGDIRVGEMDANGIDMQLIAITSPGVQVFDADTGNALAAEANDILAEAVKAHPTRFAGLAAIQPLAPKTAALEIERALGLGLKGVMINSHTKGEYLDAIAYRPILEAAEALDTPLYIHPRPAAPAMMAPMFERHLEGSMWGFQTETAVHALRMIVSGVFDDFPNLRVVLGHLGEGLPFWLDRFDRISSRGRNATDAYPFWTAKRLPSEYFLENIWMSSSGHNWDPAVRFVEEVAGEDRLMFAVDYPYEECKQQVDQAAGVKVKNPEKFYELTARSVFGIT
ncbi:MAG: amidohydrolase family protein [Rhodospirillales bacterium]|nr:amidohydrolase family protein [Rhodospirillales bacterium]MDP6643433.1 amidohydrolase family protein [Rhodospirillales bacterium]MDP6842495.1 amidohydrolase family protein [Rhodospirillales bacterium]